MRTSRIILFVRCGSLIAPLLFITAILLTTPLLLITSLRGDGLKPFPWFNRSDPKIQTQVFLRGVDLDISGKRVAIYALDVPVKGQPDLIPFGPVLEQALYQEKSSAAVDYFPAPPWRSPLAPQMKDLTDHERDGSAILHGRSKNADLVVIGGVQSAFRTAGGGLLVSISLRVISAHDGRIVWYGRKRADWIRRFPIEDCFLNLAWSFVSDWRPRERE